MVSKIWHFTWYLILWHFTWYLKYDMSHGIQNMINMTLEQIPHFNLYPQALLTTRTQVEVKVKVSIVASLPGKKRISRLSLLKLLPLSILLPDLHLLPIPILLCLNFFSSPKYLFLPLMYSLPLCTALSFINIVACYQYCCL